MLDGITVLNSFEEVVETGFNWGTMWIGLAIGLIIAFIISILDADYLGDFLYKLSIFSIIVGSLCATLAGHLINPPPLKYEARWEVVIDDSVSMNEFYNRYEFVEQRREIYVIKEKELEE